MERRNFIKGLLVSASAATGAALVKLAEPGEAAALVLQRDVLLAQPERTRFPGLQAIGAEVYVKKGDEFIAVGIMRSINVRSGLVDASMAYDGEVMLVPGIKSGTLFFAGHD